MKKFSFSLEKLKSYKEQVKKREENALAALRAEQMERLAKRKSF